MTSYNTQSATLECATSSTPPACDTAGPTGSDLSARAERVALVQMIVGEGDKLNRWEPPRTIYSPDTLRWCRHEELVILASHMGFDGSSWTEKAIIAELLTRQAQLNEVKHNVRAERVELAHAAIATCTQRLRDLLPPGVRLGDYLSYHKQHATKRKKRPARRIY